MKIAVGTDAPAIPHGKNADELVTLVDWGMPPAAVLRAATVVAADLINKPTSAASPRATSPTSSPCPAIHWPTSALHRSVNFVMKGGKVFRMTQLTELRTSSRSSSCSPSTR